MQNADILKFAKSAVLFVIVMFLVDRLIGFSLEKLYFSLKKGQFAQTTYSIDSTNQDILIFGSSRALHHYSSPILSQKLGSSLYNAGRDGQFVPYYCALEDAIFKRKLPKLLILDVNVWEVAPNDEKYEKLSMLLPYIGRHPELNKYIKEISEWESVKLVSKTYPYNSTVFVSLHDFLFAKNIPEDDNGYFPLDRTMSKKDFDTYSIKKLTYDKKREGMKVPFDTKAIKYYEYFLNQVDSLKVPTYVVISPTILKEPSTKEKLLIENIAKRYKHVKFLDYSANPKYNNQYQKFADEFHLNAAGAQEFSEEFANYISQDTTFYHK